MWQWRLLLHLLPSLPARSPIHRPPLYRYTQLNIVSRFDVFPHVERVGSSTIEASVDYLTFSTPPTPSLLLNTSRPVV